MQTHNLIPQNLIHILYIDFQGKVWYNAFVRIFRTNF